MSGCEAREPNEQTASGPELAQQQGNTQTAAPPASCTQDAQCASLNSACARGVCDPATSRCTAQPQAAGTSCGGEGRVCDGATRCVSCGAGATSSYAILQRDIFDTPTHGCTASFCHGSSPGQGLLDLRASAAYDALFDEPSTLSPLKRIDPGKPEQSFLYQKIAAATLGTPVQGGDKMPAGGFPPVPERALAGLKRWIEAGAPREGFVAGTLEDLCSGCTADADCDNGNVCDGAERCEAGTCVAGPALSCDDGSDCTRDACDPKTGCANPVSAGLSCGDNGVCDAAGTCNPRAPGSPGLLTQVWDVPLPKAVSSTPVVAGDVVYATGWDGIVYALDRATGREVWTFNTGAPVIHAGAALAPDGSILIGDGAAVVFRLDKRGAVIWKRSLDETTADHIWSPVTVHDGLVYVPLASHSDVPCTKGRVVALDLETGEPVWTRWNVPRDGVCRADTAIECKTNADCPGESACEVARGGAVTARVTVAPDGKSVYVNTVGCYTFPQIGDTDAMMKLDAKTGEVQWLKRFSESEQFNYCTNSGKDCRTVADCGSDGGACVQKAAYYDFGFINGPLYVEAKDAHGATRPLVVSGNKSGSLYALHADTGEMAWVRELAPRPVSPRFAGFGLFNGALAYSDGRFYGALYELPGGPQPKHLQAFSEVDGSTVWEDEIGKSWGSITHHDGVIYMGTQALPEFYAYDAATGARLGIYPLPSVTAAAPSVDGKELFIGYGLGGAGGVRAYRMQ